VHGLKGIDAFAKVSQKHAPRAFYWVMGLFLRYGYGIFLAALASCLAFAQDGGPHPYPLTIAGQQVSIAEQQPAPSNSGPKSVANPYSAQNLIQAQGRVVDQFGAAVGSATVLFRAKGCDIESGIADFVAVTNGYGEFSIALPPGIYGAWVQGLHDCVEIKAGEAALRLTLKGDFAREDVDPALPESRFQKIAGSAAINCGRVGINKDRTRATACAMRAYRRHKAFYVIYDEQGVDAFVSTGFAWNGKNKDVPYFVEYDSMGLSTDARVGTTQPDGSHTVVTRCSQPVRVFVNDEGEQECFRDKEMWEHMIEGGNRETFLNAGMTGYRELIPALKKHQADPEANDDPEDTEGLLMALAKLGDREQMQALVCELHTGSPQEMQAVALDKISYVGGWYAIQIYRELLTPEAKVRFEQARLRQQSDVALSKPQWWALSSLLRVAPYPPPSGIDYAFNLAAMPDYARIWLAWIRENKPTLKKLQPTGAGVDLSGKACKSKSKM
jgi:hypothetical protein